MTLQHALKPLQEINGYLASAVFDMTGKVLIAHNNSKYHIGTNATDIIKTVDSCVKTANEGSLGEVYFLQINSESGVFCVAWAVENQSIATVLLEPKGNVGLAKLALTKLSEEMNTQSQALSSN